MSLDMALLLWIQENLRSALFDSIMPVVTTLGDRGLVWILAAFFLIVGKRSGKYGAAIFIALLFAAVLGDMAMKPLIARPRPFTALNMSDLLIMPPAGYSFPSGHTMSSFASSTVLFRMDRRIGRWALFLAALIAFSRLYLFVHYPGDVLAGALLGVLVGMLTFRVTDKTSEKVAVWVRRK